MTTNGRDTTETRNGDGSTEVQNATDGERGRTVSRRTFVRAGAAGTCALALGGVPTAAAATVERESCERGDVFELGDGGWHLLNNQWGMPDSEQCIRVFEDGRYGYEFTAVGNGINYPEVFCGGRPWGSDTGIAELPAPRSEIDELDLEFDVDVDVSGGEWNLAEEWWLLDGQPRSENPPLTHEIMLVLDWGEEHSHGPPDVGAAIEDSHGNVIDLWSANVSGGTDAAFHVFRLAEPATSGVVDLTAIMEYLTEEFGVDEHLAFTGVEVGSEYWQGTSGEVTYNALDLTVNGTTYESRPGATGDGNDRNDGNENGDGDDDGDEDVIELGDFQARDTTGDGLYDDVTGDGQTTHEDVSAFFEYLESDGVQNNPDAFDFADDGRVGFADVVELLRQV